MLKHTKISNMTRLITTKSFLVPTTERLSDVLKELYLVPDYQRDYSWTKDEFRDFWEDISSLADNSFSSTGSLVANPFPHFLGPIVLQEFIEDADRRLEIMDGQQRLVTTSVFLSILFEFCIDISNAELSSRLTDTIKSLLLTPTLTGNNYHLILARDNNHYQEIVMKRLNFADKKIYWESQISSRTPKYAVINRLKDCSEFFYFSVTKYLEGLSGPDRDTKLNNLMLSLLELCVVLQMKVLEHGVAYEVFESLNARGLDLQQADLVKNKLFSMAEVHGSKLHVVEAWERVVKAIQQQSMITLNEFFYFYTVSKFHYLKQSDLYREVIKIISMPGNSPLTYISGAAECAENLQIVLEAGSIFPSHVARDIFSLKELITNKFSLTMIMAGLSRYPVNSPDLGEVIKFTHHYVFRKFIIEGQSMSSYAHDITQIARDFSNKILVDISALRTKFKSLSTDQNFIDKFEIYAVPNNKIGFYVIEMIENFINNDAGMIVQRQSASQHLEHVMPKKPTITDWGHVINDDKYNDYVSKIGNLLILEADKNSFIKNKSFNFKNTNPSNLDYQNSRLNFPKDVVKFLNGSIWDFQSIENRQKDLIKNYALLVWDL